MYAPFFGLTQAPFSIAPDPHMLFIVAASHGPALRSDPIYVTRELFFRLFIESGVAASVSVTAGVAKTGNATSPSRGDSASKDGKKRKAVN